jgi:dodecin
MTTIKYIEIVGLSPDSFDDAIQKVVADAGETLRDMKWLEVTEQRCKLQGNTVIEYQVTCKIAFKIMREA